MENKQLRQMMRSECGAEQKEGNALCVECNNSSDFLELFAENLKKGLTCAVEHQLADPNGVLWCDSDCVAMFGDDDEAMSEFLESEESNIVGEIVSSITNSLFRTDNGEDVFAGTSNDGKPHLMLDLTFYESMDYKDIVDRFQLNPVFEKFTTVHYRSKFCREMHCYIDCGDDVDQMVDIVKILVRDAYCIKLKYKWCFDTFLFNTKEEIRREVVRLSRKLKYEQFERPSFSDLGIRTD